MAQSTHTDAPKLVADIGGTSARLALARGGRLLDGTLRTYQRSGFPGPEDAMQRFLEEVGESLSGGTACIAMASPVDRQRIAASPEEPITFTNSPWAVIPARIQRRFGLDRLLIINDFEAQAYALPQLGPDQRLAIGHEAEAREPDPRWPLLVVGPGTGLGAALWLSQSRSAVCTEGGHVSFAPSDEVEIDILRKLFNRHGHVAVERLLSGDGLVSIHACLHDDESLSAAQITAGALSGEVPRCAATLDRFFAILGSTVGDLTLGTGARGGVFLAGGILPRVAELLQRSRFRECFIAKGRFRHYLDAVPTWLVVAPQPGLLGAAAAAELL